MQLDFEDLTLTLSFDADTLELVEVGALVDPSAGELDEPVRRVLKALGLPEVFPGGQHVELAGAAREVRDRLGRLALLRQVRELSAEPGSVLWDMEDWSLLGLIPEEVSRWLPQMDEPLGRVEEAADLPH
ncbi:MAG: hypothetical protein M1522_07315, partial [Actinobacteria bacterium]|nr:hypothetical protein [Actinomycetota bacterium]